MNSSKLNISYEDLFNLYVIDKLSYKTIGQMYNVDASTVQRKIHKSGIKPRNTYDTLEKELDENKIIHLYLKENKSCSEIAVLMDTTSTTVSSRLKRNNIEIRPQRDYVCGEKSNFWKDGISTENTIIRSSSVYKHWRETVFSRDMYVCQCCFDDKGGNLHAHHIFNFAEYEEIRFDVKNGIALCSSCHDFKYSGSFHNLYGTRNNNAKQLIEYIINRRTELGIEDMTIPSVLLI